MRSFTVKENHIGSVVTHTDGQSHTHFLDETKLENEPHTKYLGITADERAYIKPDLNTRIASTMAIAPSPNNFWQISSHPKFEVSR